MNFREEEGAVYYFLSFTQNGINFTESNETQIYNNKRSSGIIRKAVVNNPVSKFEGQKFIDSFKFTLPPNCKLVRLYDYFQKQLDLFPENEIQSSYIKMQPFYNTFMSQSGIISYQYTKSLFITQTINSQGYYQYFIKRNGEYFVEECDDLIPVQNKTFKPIWGLTIDHPWQIMLMKAWLKQCGSFQAMNAAEPFSFIQAFGLPSYRVFNFRKEKKFLLKERLSKEEKAQNLKEFQIYNTNSIILGKTINHPTVSKIGLIPNTAAYRLQKIKEQNGEVLFKVYSSLPCAWVGTHSAVALTPLNKIYNQELTLDLERTIIMTQKQVLALFHKFYVAPGMFSKPRKFFSQDCINLAVQNSSPVWVKFSVVQKTGLLSFSIQVPKKKVDQKYPQFRYFLSKKTDEQEVSRSHYHQDIATSKLLSNIHITSTCNKWEYYQIDYVQGYQNHSTGFIKVTEGEYVLFVHAQMNGVIRVRLDSQVKIQNLQQFQPSAKISKQIFDSTFFTISCDSSVQATFNQQTFEQSISLNNSFEQNGFGSICIKTLPKAKHKVAMRVYPDKLREEGYQLLAHYDQYQDSQTKQKNFVLISSRGKPQIIVLQRINQKSRSEIGEIFPPKGCVQFFKVTPNNVFNPMVPVTSSAFK